MGNKKITINNFHNLSFLIHGRIKMARLFGMGEDEFLEELKKIEKDSLFLKLKTLGIIVLIKSGNFIESSRKFEGMWLKNLAQTPTELLDSDSDIVVLIRKIGEERFKKFFLGDEYFSNEVISKECGIKQEDIIRVKDFINSIYVKEEFNSCRAPLPEKYYSCVGAIKVEKGKPVIVFFFRNIWKNIYKVNDFKLKELENFLKPDEKKKVESILKKIEFMEKRKSSLYKLLEFIIIYQRKYLISGNLLDIKPISQREVANKLNIDSSVLCRILSNKSIELPWGVEVKIKDLLPSNKKVNKERVYDLIYKNTDISDFEISKKMFKLFKVKLSRRTINQYRNELKLELKS